MMSETRSIFASLAKIACAAVSAATLVTAVSSVAQAQPYPERPVSMVVPYPAGGAIDASARRLAEFLSRELGQPVVIENRQGANSVVGTSYVAQADPDGHTLLFTTFVAQAGNVLDYDSLPYDTFEDFAPVTAIQAPPNVLAAHPSVPAGSVGELVAYARENPGQLTIGTNGPGSPAHLRGVQLRRSGDADISLIAYPGGAAALTALVGGHISLYPAQLTSVVSFVNEQQLKILAVLGKKRLPSLPDVPSITETPGFENFEELATFPLILAPASTPPEVIDRLYTVIAGIIQTEEFRALSQKAGEYEPFALTPDEAGARLREYLDLLKQLND